jgi:hypothetical protein
MKKTKFALAFLAVSAGALSAGPALAWGGHHHGHGGHGGARVFFGLNLGVPLYAPAPYYYYPAPVYYQPAPVVVQPPAPPVYVERSEAPAPSQPAAGYWYYCGDSRAYYPYVRDCPGGWQRVSPTPPG